MSQKCVITESYENWNVVIGVFSTERIICVQNICHENM